MKSGWLEYVEKTGVLYMCHGNWLGDISASQHQRRSQKTAKKTARKRKDKKQVEGGVAACAWAFDFFCSFYLLLSHCPLVFWRSLCRISESGGLSAGQLPSSSSKKKEKKENQETQQAPGAKQYASQVMTGVKTCPNRKTRRCAPLPRKRTPGPPEVFRTNSVRAKKSRTQSLIKVLWAGAKKLLGISPFFWPPKPYSHHA